MRRIGVVLASAAFVAASLVQGGTAHALGIEQVLGIEWCAEDPVFQVLGADFRITTTVGAPASAVISLAYTVHLPSNAEGSAAVHFENGRRLPTSIVLVYDGPQAGPTFTVSVAIVVTATRAADVTAAVSGPSVTDTTNSGNTDSPLTLTFEATSK